MEGKYTYDDGTVGVENSLLINNISKEDAVRITKDINQESIIWNDSDFFGFLDSDGNPDWEFPNRTLGFDNETLKMYGSRLATNHNTGKEFVFEMYSKYVKGGSAVRNMSSKFLRENIIEELLVKIKVS